MLAMSGFWLWWFFALIVWVAIAFWPARVAGRKGTASSGSLSSACSSSPPR
jgi:hypothetical protein